MNATARRVQAEEASQAEETAAWVVKLPFISTRGNSAPAAAAGRSSGAGDASAPSGHASADSLAGGNSAGAPVLGEFLAYRQSELMKKYKQSELLKMAARAADAAEAATSTEEAAAAMTASTKAAAAAMEKDRWSPGHSAPGSPTWQFRERADSVPVGFMAGGGRVSLEDYAPPYLSHAPPDVTARPAQHGALAPPPPPDAAWQPGSPLGTERCADSSSGASSATEPLPRQAPSHASAFHTVPPDATPAPRGGPATSSGGDEAARSADSNGELLTRHSRESSRSRLLSLQTIVEAAPERERLSSSEGL
jgi:hypothetical protein